MALSDSSTVYRHLCEMHHEYRNTKEIDAKKEFYAPDCRQMCRTDPEYAARDRETIARYVSEGAEAVERIFREAGYGRGDAQFVWSPQTSCYSVRPLTEDEARDFGAPECFAPAGFSSAEEAQDKARDEGWVGLRVNMWDDDGKGRGLLVKVKYWWRLDDVGKDEKVWRQVLHDILYLGVRDGTEEKEGGIRIYDNMP